MNKPDEPAESRNALESDLSSGIVLGIPGTKSGSPCLAELLRKEASECASVQPEVGCSAEWYTWSDESDQEDQLDGQDENPAGCTKELMVLNTIRSIIKGSSADKSLVLPKGLHTLPRLDSYFRHAAKFSATALKTDETVSLTRQDNAFGLFWSLDSAEVTRALESLKVSYDNRLLSSFLTLDCFFRSLLVLPTKADLKDVNDPGYAGIKYAASYLVMCYQEAKYGNKVASMRPMLLSRLTGRKEIDEAIQVAFPRGPATRLVVITEVLLKNAVRAAVNGTDTKSLQLVDYLEALSRWALVSAGTLCDAQSRVTKIKTEVQIPGSKKTKSVFREIRKKPLLETQRMPLTSVEGQIARNVNATIDMLPKVITSTLQGAWKDGNLETAKSLVQRTVADLYNATDSVNRVIHDRRRRIRDLCLRHRQTDGKSVSGSLTPTEWLMCQQELLSGEEEHKAFLEACTLLVGVSRPEDSHLLAWGAKELECNVLASYEKARSLKSPVFSKFTATC